MTVHRRQLAELQTLLDQFVDDYNHRRPHRSLGRTTPAVAYGLLPKATPATTTAGTHYRIRRDRVDKTSADKTGAVSLRRAGRMHHISIGRANAGTSVVLLIADLDIRAINTATGELLRHLTLNPDIGYQPRRE